MEKKLWILAVVGDHIQVILPRPAGARIRVYLGLVRLALVSLVLSKFGGYVWEDNFGHLSQVQLLGTHLSFMEYLNFS